MVTGLLKERPEILEQYLTEWGLNLEWTPMRTIFLLNVLFSLESIKDLLSHILFFVLSRRDILKASGNKVIHRISFLSL